MDEKLNKMFFLIYLLHILLVLNLKSNRSSYFSNNSPVTIFHVGEKLFLRVQEVAGVHQPGQVLRGELNAGAVELRRVEGQ